MIFLLSAMDALKCQNDQNKCEMEAGHCDSEFRRVLIFFVVNVNLSKFKNDFVR